MDMDHVVDLIRKANAYDLDLGFHLPFLAEDEVADAYNGIGAEWMPETIRNKISTDYSDIEPSAMIHDVDYSHGDGTVSDFHAANIRLRNNILRTANLVATPIISWKWWKLRMAASACFEAVESFGLSAYVSAVTKKGKNT